MDGIEPARADPAGHPRLLPQHVKRALAYMNANMAERITLAGLASDCGCPNALAQTISAVRRSSTAGYLRRLRLNAVRNELTSAENNESRISRSAADFPILGALPPNIADCSGERHPRQGNVYARTAPLWRSSSASCSGDDLLHRSPGGTRRPSLLILPWRTETLREELEARDLTERLAATLSRMGIANCVVGASFARPFDERTTAAKWRHAILPAGQADAAGERLAWLSGWSTSPPIVMSGATVSMALSMIPSNCRTVSSMARCAVSCRVSPTLRSNVCMRGIPGNLGARDLAMQALPLILGANAASARKAVAILSRAVARDPADAVAAALLSFTQIELVGRYATE